MIPCAETKRRAVEKAKRATMKKAMSWLAVSRIVVREVEMTTDMA